MVGTRASTRLKAASKEELNYRHSKMTDVDSDVQENVKEVEEEVNERVEAEDVEPPTQCKKCDELKSTEKEVPVTTKPPAPVSNYLVGFAKRVVICTLLVFAFKSVWPQLQSRFWPEPPVKEGKCYVLNDKSFRGHVSRGDHILMMYAPWCGHCQKLKPTWDKIAKKPGVDGIKVGKVDCTASETTCKEFDVKGYPTILYFRNGTKIGNYNGAKTETEIKEYMSRMRSGNSEPNLEDMMPPPPPPKKPSKKKGKKKPAKEL